ncbi:MAG TPA: hypothetical protein VM889_12575 [Candidatus Thermoplasmatota archaeon]|nr:hypothetical protein [Candidatus Thermoplasmatota archaeon]
MTEDLFAARCAKLRDLTEQLRRLVSTIEALRPNGLPADSEDFALTGTLREATHENEHFLQVNDPLTQDAKMSRLPWAKTRRERELAENIAATNAAIIKSEKLIAAAQKGIRRHLERTEARIANAARTLERSEQVVPGSRCVPQLKETLEAAANAARRVREGHGDVGELAHLTSRVTEGVSGLDAALTLIELTRSDAAKTPDPLGAGQRFLDTRLARLQADSTPDELRASATSLEASWRTVKADFLPILTRSDAAAAHAITAVESLPGSLTDNLRETALALAREVKAFDLQSFKLKSALATAEWLDEAARQAPRISVIANVPGIEASPEWRTLTRVLASRHPPAEIEDAVRKAEDRAATIQRNSAAELQFKTILVRESVPNELAKAVESTIVRLWAQFPEATKSDDAQLIEPIFREIISSAREGKAFLIEHGVGQYAPNLFESMNTLLERLPHVRVGEARSILNRMKERVQPLLELDLAKRKFAAIERGVNNDIFIQIENGILSGIDIQDIRVATEALVKLADRFAKAPPEMLAEEEGRRGLVRANLSPTQRKNRYLSALIENTLPVLARDPEQPKRNRDSDRDRFIEKTFPIYFDREVLAACVGARGPAEFDATLIRAHSIGYEQFRDRFYFHRGRARAQFAKNGPDSDAIKNRLRKEFSILDYEALQEWINEGEPK